MKQCPACNRVYTDESLIYCLADGSLLTSKYDSEATQILPAHELPPTVLAVPPTVASPKPAQTSPPTLPYSPTPSYPPAPAPTVRQGVNPAVVYVLIAVLALVVGAGAMLLLRPAAKDNPSPSPTPSPTQQPETNKNSNGTETKEQTKGGNSNLSSPSPTPSSTPRPTPTEMTRPSGLPGSYPEASSRYLSEGDLASKSCFELQVMRNEIFARHGYIFKTDDMRSYFSQQGWYRPRAADVSGELSAVEKSNAQAIKQYESGKGCR